MNKFKDPNDMTDDELDKAIAFVRLVESSLNSLGEVGMESQIAPKKFLHIVLCYVSSLACKLQIPHDPLADHTDIHAMLCIAHAAHAAGGCKRCRDALTDAEDVAPVSPGKSN